MSRHLLAASGVTKHFGPTRALTEVTIEVGPGEIRGLIGENGSGKSTLGSIIAGEPELPLPSARALRSNVGAEFLVAEQVDVRFLLEDMFAKLEEFAAGRA